MACACCPPAAVPSLDDPRGEWCYLSKSTTVIGVPKQPDVTHVTFDGAIFARNAELRFFYGEPVRPVMARQKTFLDGWTPIVCYGWAAETLRYAGSQASIRRPLTRLSSQPVRDSWLIRRRRIENG